MTGPQSLADVVVFRLGASAIPGFVAEHLAANGAQVIPASRASLHALLGDVPAATPVVVVTDDSDRTGYDELACNRVSLVWYAVQPPPDDGSSLDVDAQISRTLGLVELAGEPERMPVVTVYGAALAALYIGAALVRGERTRTPVFITTVPLLAAAATVLSWRYSSSDNPKITIIMSARAYPSAKSTSAQTAVTFNRTVCMRTLSRYS